MSDTVDEKITAAKKTIESHKKRLELLTKKFLLDGEISPEEKAILDKGNQALEKLEALLAKLTKSAGDDNKDKPADTAADGRQAECSALQGQLKALMPKIQPVLDDTRVAKAEGVAMGRALDSFKAATAKTDATAAKQALDQIKIIIKDYKIWADDRNKYDETQKKSVEEKLKALMPKIKPVMEDPAVARSEGAAMGFSLKDFETAVEKKDWQKAERTLTAIAQILKDYAATKSPDSDRAKFDRLKAEMDKIKSGFGTQPEPLKKALADSSSQIARDVKTSIGDFERYLAAGKLSLAETELKSLEQLLLEARAEIRILESRHKEAMALKDAYNEAQNHPRMDSAKEVITSFEAVMNATNSETATKHLDWLKLNIKVFESELLENKANDDVLQAKLSKLETELVDLDSRIETAKKNPSLATQPEVIKLEAETIKALKDYDLAKATETIKKLKVALAAFEKELASKQSADGDDRKKKEMARWLERNRPDVNMVLKDKASKHNGNMVKWLTAYQKLLKAGRIKDAQQALDEVALVLRAYARDFKLSENQRRDIMKKVGEIEKKMLKEIDKLAKVKIDANI